VQQAAVGNLREKYIELEGMPAVLFLVMTHTWRMFHGGPVPCNIAVYDSMNYMKADVTTMQLHTMCTHRWQRLRSGASQSQGTALARTVIAL